MKMKNPEMFKTLPAFLLAISLFTFSCQKEENPFAGNDYLVSADKLYTRTAQYYNTLIASASYVYPEVIVLLDEVSDGASVYRIVYHTTFQGEDLKVSGLVCVPTTPGDYPVLSFQNGTNTLLSNAPSVNPEDDLYELLQSVASMGFVVAIPDYIGFGASAKVFHPYLHKESTVQTIIDMFYALREMDEDIDDGVSMRNEYYLMGYSQGGWSTLSLLESLDQDYPNEFNVAATACGAGSYDLSYFNQYVMDLDNYPSPAFLAYISKAYIDHGLISHTLSDFFQAPYAAAIPQLFDGEHSIDEINDDLTTDMKALFTPAYRMGFSQDAAYADLRAALKENSVTAWNCQVPLLFVHGEDDSFVPPVLTDRIYDQMLQAGTPASTCTKLMIPGEDHRGGIVPGCIAALEFFLDMQP